jgi:hypothetical protein
MKYSVSKDIPAQKSQTVGVFPYAMFTQQGYPSKKYSVSKDILAQKSQTVSFVPVRNFHPAKVSQQEIFSQLG